MNYSVIPYNLLFNSKIDILTFRINGAAHPALISNSSERKNISCCWWYSLWIFFKFYIDDGIFFFWYNIFILNRCLLQIDQTRCQQTRFWVFQAGCLCNNLTRLDTELSTSIQYLHTQYFFPGTWEIPAVYLCYLTMWWLLLWFYTFCTNRAFERSLHRGISNSGTPYTTVNRHSPSSTHTLDNQ